MTGGCEGGVTRVRGCGSDGERWGTIWGNGERAEASESDVERVLARMDNVAPLNATSRA